MTDAEYGAAVRAAKQRLDDCAAHLTEVRERTNNEALAAHKAWNEAYTALTTMVGVR